jgi:hypothetical protein
VFAEVAVKLVSRALSHENTGNQFGHLSSIFTFTFLAITAVSQIICLNRDLWVHDSTPVVPVFIRPLGKLLLYLFVPSDSFIRRNCVSL